MYVRFHNDSIRLDVSSEFIVDVDIVLLGLGLSNRSRPWWLIAFMQVGFVVDERLRSKATKNKVLQLPP